jgi:L-threonate 2-dehydrogenase
MSARKRKDTVGIVGLGIMRGAFATNLVADGWRVIGFDLDPGRRRAMARADVEIATGTKALAHEATIIITSLPNPEALNAVVAEIVAAKVPPRVIIETSTFTLTDKEGAEDMLKKAGTSRSPARSAATPHRPRSRISSSTQAENPKASRRCGRCSSRLPNPSMISAAFSNGSRMKYVANSKVSIWSAPAPEIPACSSGACR